ncbi:hypothetical protein SAMN05216436_101314 [bacterium A37T11]|nr:hypothetical protein SAMN05216436_101314 [bacterium A37T11]
MASINLSASEWGILKLKFQRKYNHLNDADLYLEPGEEDALIDRLAKRIHRDRAYVLFTLKKGLSDLESNRL